MTTGLRPAWTDGSALLALLLAVVALFVPMTQAMIVEDIGTDYYDQILDARSVLETGRSDVPRPNLLFNRLLVLLAWPLNGDLATAALIVSVIAYGLTAVMLYAWLKPVWPWPQSPWAAWGSAALALSLIVVAPLFFLLGQSSDQALNGYLTFSLYHNPTTLLAKPLALAQFALAVRVLRPQAQKAAERMAMLLAALLVTALSMAAKFSFTVALLPALVLLALWRAWRRGSVDWGLLLACLATALPLLLAQYSVFAGSGDGSRATIDFLGYYRAIGEDLSLLPLKWLASLAFPVCMCLLLLRRAVWQDQSLLLSWLVFGVAWAQAVLLVEQGLRIEHGNFAWGALYAAFVLFALSLRRLLSMLRGRPSGAPLLLALYGLHILAGLDWFAFNLRG
ncbi:MAG: hypothetical protein NZ750_11970 [Anaerolineae bacterium]|nr:hypothetical protein [Anaerolineae bacterium]MDW8173921.1 hypothetical protein [Anaerolineae bacterium]